MRVRDLPTELLLTYSGTLLATGLPAAWIDMDYLEFLLWIDAARKDQDATKERWEHVTGLRHEAALLILPVIQKCPALSMQEAVEMLPAAERERCLFVLNELAGP